MYGDSKMYTMGGQATNMTVILQVQCNVSNSRPRHQNLASRINLPEIVSSSLWKWLGWGVIDITVHTGHARVIELREFL